MIIVEFLHNRLCPLMVKTGASAGNPFELDDSLMIVMPGDDMTLTLPTLMLSLASLQPVIVMELACWPVVSETV